jgi:phage shock protein PspC (stress-responsive transcriptional regulator)
MPVKRLYRSRDNRVICGVAAGVGAYFEVNPTIIRILMVVAALAGLAPAIVAYVAGCFLIPDEPLID